MCARRVTFSESTKQPERKEYFNSKYALSKVVGMKKPGDEAFVLLLKPEEYLFQIEYHTVREKVHGKIGFKGAYDTKIVCKRFDVEGNRAEEMPLCCELADRLFKEAKEKAIEECKKLGKDPGEKKNLNINAPMTFTGTQIYIPLIVLGTTETEVGSKPKISKVAIKDGRRMFAYLEINKKSYVSDIYNKLKEQLEASGELDTDISEEEVSEVMLHKFKTHIIKISAVEAKGTVAYEKNYTFIPFTNENIAKLSGQYNDIVNYEKDEQLMNDSADFLSLFEVEVDKLVKDWTDDELSKYLIEDAKKAEDMEEFKKADAKVRQQQQIEEPEEIKLKVPPKVEEAAPPIAQASEVVISEDDLVFDEMDSDFIDDDDFSDD